MLDATSAGIGAKNKQLYQAHGLKAVFQGGEAGEVADVFFHGYANYDKGVGADFLKLTSCNTTGLIRAVDCLDKAAGSRRSRSPSFAGSPIQATPSRARRPAAD